MARSGDVTSPRGLAALAAIVSLAVSVAVMWARPDLTRGAAFLFSDQAANLFVAHALHQGASLFTGVAFPYGPVSIELYARLSEWLGNTPLVYLGVMAVLAAASAGMVLWLVGRFVDRRTALATIAFGVAATMPLPGANIGGYTSSIYMPIERLCLLGAAVLWTSPIERRVRTSLSIGAGARFLPGRAVRERRGRRRLGDRGRPRRIGSRRSLEVDPGGPAIERSGSRRIPRVRERVGRLGVRHVTASIRTGVSVAAPDVGNAPVQRRATMADVGWLEDGGDDVCAARDRSLLGVRRVLAVGREFCGRAHHPVGC